MGGSKRMMVSILYQLPTACPQVGGCPQAPHDDAISWKKKHKPGFAIGAQRPPGKIGVAWKFDDEKERKMNPP
jgi:hypothetical protein